MRGDWQEVIINPENSLERAYALEVFKASNIGKAEDGKLYYNAAEAQEIKEMILQQRYLYGPRTTKQRIYSSLIRRGINPVDLAIATAVRTRLTEPAKSQLHVWELLSKLGREPFTYMPSPQLYLIASLDYVYFTSLPFFKGLYNGYLDGKTVMRFSNGNVWIVLGIDGKHELSALKLTPVKKSKSFNYHNCKINYGIVAAYSVWRFDSLSPVPARQRDVREAFKDMGVEAREVFDEFYGCLGLADEVELFLYLGEE